MHERERTKNIPGLMVKVYSYSGDVVVVQRAEVNTLQVSTKNAPALLKQLYYMCKIQCVFTSQQ